MDIDNLKNELATYGVSRSGDDALDERDRLLTITTDLVAEVERLTKERDRREGHIRVVLSERITVTRHDEMFVVQVANCADPKKTSSVQRAFLGCDEITSVMTWIPRALSQVAIPGEGEVTT